MAELAEMQDKYLRLCAEFDHEKRRTANDRLDLLKTANEEMVVALLPIMIPIELVGILTKPFSLMVRLFANITAGHIIILSLFSLIFIFESFAIGPVSVAFAIFMNFLELFVALLQAYVFTLLTSMYFGGAVEEHDHADDMGHGAH